MVQILQRNPTWQENLASGLGSGVSSGITALLNQKLSQMQQAQKAQQIGKAYKAAGLPENLAYLPEEAQKSIFKAIGERGGLDLLLGEQPQQEMLQPFGQQLAQQLAPQQQVQPSLQQMLQTAKPQQLMELLNLGTVMGAPQTQPQMQTEQQQFTPQQIQPQAAKPTIAQKPRTLADILKQPTKKELSEQRKEQFAIQKEINKETKPYFDKIVADKDFADFSDIRIQKMENLVKKGRLPFSGLYSALKNLEEHVPATYGAAAGAGVGGALGGPIGAAIGGGIGGLISPVASILRSIQNKTSPDTEEFTKLSNEFIKGAKNLFGARVTNDELKAYLSTLPTLANTDEAKLAIINNMKIANKAAKAKYKAMQKIIHANNGIRPQNLIELIDQVAKPELDKLAIEFIS